MAQFSMTIYKNPDMRLKFSERYWIFTKVIPHVCLLNNTGLPNKLWVEYVIILIIYGNRSQLIHHCALWEINLSWSDKRQQDIITCREKTVVRLILLMLRAVCLSNYLHIVTLKLHWLFMFKSWTTNTLIIHTGIYRLPTIQFLKSQDVVYLPSPACRISQSIDPLDKLYW